MARRRYRRYRRSRNKWSANIQEVGQYEIQPNPGEFADSVDLVTSPSQSPSLTSQIYTVKNVEATFVFEGRSINADVVENLSVFLMYVPQGMAIGLDYHLQHPEYIMAYKFYGSPSIDNDGNAAPVGQQYQPIKIRSRLARKLNTGDKIVLFYKGFNISSSTANLTLTGLVRWWTKAN